MGIHPAGFGVNQQNGVTVSARRSGNRMCKMVFQYVIACLADRACKFHLYLPLTLYFQIIDHLDGVPFKGAASAMLFSAWV
ncbi:MAG: hypothetical protein P8X80_15805 [Desulfobacterales bacterium]